ncbi:MAG: ABC transporter substrate-binding protein [Proteobacteria bacterium]|nr:ABC transporter substrate-binding protein [Pseudomonadota bacterium]
MKRRDLLGKALIGGAFLTACGEKNSDPSAPAVHTKKKIRWRMASSFPPSLDTLYGSAEVLADKVREMTDGLFDIKVYPGGKLVPALEVLDSVQKGAIQAGQSASYYYVGKNPALAFDCCVPFGMTARQQAAWLHQGGGLELTRKLFSDFNILNFPAGNTGAQMGGWFKREVNGLSDMQGLKMRIPGLGGKVMDKLGVAVQTLPGGEIYTALERGAIDATEWVGPYDDEKLGFHKVAKYYYYPGWWEPGPSLSFYVNNKEWEQLPADYKAIFTAAAKEAEVGMTARYDALNPAALTRLLAEGVQMRPFAPELLEKAFTAAKELLEENAVNDPEYARVYTPWKEARKEAFRWFGTAEASYAQFTFNK